MSIITKIKKKIVGVFKQYYYKCLPVLGIKKLKIHINNYIMYVNPKDQYVAKKLFMQKKYEPFLTKLMSSVIKRGDIFIDIGAQFGYYSLLASTKVGDTGKVISFEPSTENYSFLKKSISANKFVNIQLEHKAVLDHNGEIKLFLANENFGDHRTYQSDDDNIYNRGKERAELTVECVSLDTYFSKNKMIPNVMKIDTQGAEVYVFEGFKNTLKNVNDIFIFMEFWPYGLNKSGSSAEDLTNVLNAHNFYIGVISGSSIRVVKKEELMGFMKSTHDHINIVCTRDIERLKNLV